MNSILVVEDDKSLTQVLKDLLTDEGYSVRVAQDGTEALNAVKKIEPDLVILDLGLPNMSGESVCKEMKKKYPDLPVLILTARDSSSDIVQGLNLGADDYMTKPFDSDVFMARVRARLRAKGTSEKTIKVADLVLDTKTFKAKRGGKTIDLTPHEFKLLEYLMINKGQVLKREMILNRVWLSSPDIETRVVDVYIGYLKKKVDNDFPKKLIQSVRGFGYTIRD